MEYLGYILVGFLSAFIAARLGYEINQLGWWVVSMPIIIFGNIIINFCEICKCIGN